MEDDEPKVRWICNDASSLCLIASVTKTLSQKLWLPVVSCRVHFYAAVTAPPQLVQTYWASFKLTGGDAPAVSVLQDGAQCGLITPASIHWAPWVHPAARAELHTTRDTLLAVPELRGSLDIPVGAAVPSLECGHVWTTATLSQILILNYFRDPHWLQGLN